MVFISILSFTVLFNWSNSIASIPLFLLFLARLIDGLSGGTAATATTILADISSPEKRAKTFGLIGVAFGLSFFLGNIFVVIFAKNTNNNFINEKNNIHELIQNLDSDQTISICMSALLKKEKSGQYIKKAYFDEIIKCPSKKFASNCLNRGLFPFGPIQSIIYRLDDIISNKNKFLEEFPINADEIFSFEEACKRENIMFNPHPQITWDLTQGRFHGKVKIEDEFKEHTDTIEIVKSKTNLDVNYGLISTYRAINLIKFSAKNFQHKNGKKEAITHLLSKIKESGTFFNTDKILIKTLFDKLKNSDKDADDLLYKSIITRCVDESKN